MKILLSTNTFNKYTRQDVAIQSYKKLKELYPDVLDIINIQFKDEENNFNNHYELNVKYDLTRSSLDYIKNPQKKLPFVNDLFKIVSNYSEDYCIFTNSDVIINKNLINFIINKQPECFACSRLDIEHINDFSELKEKIKPVRWEIAGFDTFIFKKKWFLKHQHLFNDYLLGKPLYDVAYCGIMQAFGDGTPIGNQYPPFCFHIHHGLDAVTRDTPEKTFNEKTLENNMLDKFLVKMMFFNLKYNLCLRKPWGAFLQYDEQEIFRQQKYFDNFNFYKDNSVV